MTRCVKFAVTGVLGLALSAPIVAQAPAGQAPSAGQAPQGEGRGQGEGRSEGRGRGRGGPGTLPLSMDDRAGFESIFDGTMKGWDGDQAYWRAEGGSLVGESTPANPLKENTFV